MTEAHKKNKMIQVPRDFDIKITDNSLDYEIPVSLDIMLIGSIGLNNKTDTIDGSLHHGYSLKEYKESIIKDYKDEFHNVKIINVRIGEIKEVEWLKQDDLVTFGNYLLSNERKHKTSELNQNNVTHADIENWKETRQ